MPAVKMTSEIYEPAHLYIRRQAYPDIRGVEAIGVFFTRKNALEAFDRLYKFTIDYTVCAVCSRYELCKFN
jgi:hypothetical protein